MNVGRESTDSTMVSCGPSQESGSVRRRLPAWRWLLLFGLLVVSATSETRAHNLGQSYLYLQIHPEKLSGRFEIALSDLNPALGLTGTDREITADNLDENIGFLKDYYLEHVTISGEQGPLAITFQDAEVLNARGGYVLLPFELGGFTDAPEVLDIDYSVLFEEEPDHRGFFLVEHNWATGTFANENQVSLVFSPNSRRQSFDVQSSGRWQGFAAVVGLGFEHMVLGFDHVMFLVALLLPSVLRRDQTGTWQPLERFAPALINVAKIVAAFAAAHFVAFSLVALDLVRLPERLVEVVIALSITVAATNILVPLIKNRIWLFVFGVGLFHGLGFAGALSEMGIGGENLGLSRLAFNVGIELGQVVIVAVLLPLFFLVRRWTLYRRVVLPVAAVVMILVSMIWVVERAFGLDFRLTRRVKSLVRRFV